MRKLLNLTGVALIVAAMTAITFFAGYNRGFDTGRVDTASLYLGPVESAGGPGALSLARFATDSICGGPLRVRGRRGGPLWHQLQLIPSLRPPIACVRRSALG